MEKHQTYYIADLYEKVRSLAVSKGYSVHKISWLRSLKSYSQQLERSRKNIENGGWHIEKRKERETGKIIIDVSKIDRS